jgi:lipooligosaccharide transport system ATP-binding protein
MPTAWPLTKPVVTVSRGRMSAAAAAASSCRPVPAMTPARLARPAAPCKTGGTRGPIAWARPGANDAAVPEAIVEVRALAKRYGARQAVDDVSFRVEAGECVGLLGPNGAGKTTTIRMLTGFAVPSGGEVRVLGLPFGPATAAAIKARLGIVSQEDNLDPDLSVEKNLVIYASYFGIPWREATRRAETAVRFAELGDHRHDRIAALSGGMRRRLMLARALLNEPRLLILDEPTTGLDPQARRLVWERIRDLKRAGTTILLTTHYMDEAAQLCDRLIIMDGGRIVAGGRPDELVARYVGSEVVEVHLPEGVDAEAILAGLGPGDWRSEQAGRMLYLLLRDGHADAVLARVGDLDVTRRRATLEDVFLSLTGHQLRE